MAYVSIPRIKKMEIVPFFSSERTIKTTGEMAIHPEVVAMYVSKGYDKAPLTAKEAEDRGLTNFNGLITSIPKIEQRQEADYVNLRVHIYPTRYLFSQAVKDIVKERKLSPEDASKITPNMANVSLLAPVKDHDHSYLLAQIKGKAVGSGEIQAAIAAGGVNAKYLAFGNPLIKALQSETSEEVGMSLSDIGYEPFIFMVDESELGNVNFAATSTGISLDKVLEIYEAQTKEKLATEKDLEVMGLVLIPLNDFTLQTLDDGSKGLKGVTCYIPSKTGLVKSVEDRKVRPYTVAVQQFLSEKRNLDFLLSKAGH